MEVNVKVSKVVSLSNNGGDSGVKMNLSIVEQNQINELVGNFLEANFRMRKYILSCSNVKKTDKKLIKFFKKEI